MDEYKTVQSVVPDLAGDSHRFKTPKGEISSLSCIKCGGTL